jgi:hypothetical protein
MTSPNPKSVEDIKMTTQITLAAIEATLRKIITDNGTILVRISQEALDQMNDITEKLRAVSGYSDDQLNEVELEIAMERAQNFHNRYLAFPDDIVDGVLRPVNQEMLDLAIDAINTKWTQATPGMLAPVFLVNKIVNDAKSFAI